MRLAYLTDLAYTQTDMGEETNDDDAARVEGAPSSAEEILLEEKALVDDAEKDANATTAATNGGELVGDGNSAGDSSDLERLERSPRASPPLGLSGGFTLC